MPPFEYLIFEFSSLILGAVILFKLWQESNKFHFLAFLVAVLMTTIVELTGIRDGHSYYYADEFLIVIPATINLANLVGGTGRDFPIFIAVDWAVIVYCLTRMGERLNVTWYLLPFVFGLLAVSLDMTLDPIAASSKLVPDLSVSCFASTQQGAAEGVGYWVWCIPDGPNQFFLGVPIQNFYGWFLVVAVYTYFQSIAYRHSYNEPWTQQVMTLLVTTSASISTFFLVLGYFIDMGYVWGWWIWGALMAAGVFVLFRAGVNRTQYHFDIWAVIIVLANALFAVFAVVLQLWGSVSMELIVYCGLWLVFSLLLAAWILFGKRMLGQPYP